MSPAVIDLERALLPIAHIMGDPATEDVAFNEPAKVWWLTAGAWRTAIAPAMSWTRLHGIAVLAASQTHKRIDTRQPLLSCDIPSGHRLQAVLPPAVPLGTISLTFRRPSDTVSPLSDMRSRYEVSRWNRWSARTEQRQAESGALLERFDAGDIEGFLTGCAAARMTALFCGPTGAGKTFLAKTFLTLLPLEARIVVIEDAHEAVVRQRNYVRLLFGDVMSPAQALTASLRMRPDYVCIGELRDAEAGWIHVNEVTAGHPGSPTTIHGQTAPQAAKRLFNLVKGSEEGRMMEDATVANLLATAVDLIVPIATDGGARSIRECWFAPDAARRGETFHDLLREA